MQIVNGRTENGFPSKVKVVVEFSEREPLETYAECVGINIDNGNLVEYQIVVAYKEISGHTLQEIYLDSLPYNAYASFMVRGDLAETSRDA